MSWRPEDSEPPELRAEFDKALIVMGGDMIDGPLFLPIGLSPKDKEFLELKRQLDAEILNWARMWERYWPHRQEPEARDGHGDRLRPKPRVEHYT